MPKGVCACSMTMLLVPTHLETVSQQVLQNAEFCFPFQSFSISTWDSPWGLGSEHVSLTGVSPAPLICEKHPSLMVLSLSLNSKAEGFPNIHIGSHLGTRAWRCRKTQIHLYLRHWYTPNSHETRDLWDLRPAGTWPSNINFATMWGNRNFSVMSLRWRSSKKAVVLDGDYLQTDNSVHFISSLNSQNQAGG